MTVTIRLDGGDELQAALGKLSDKIRRQVSEAVEDTAAELQSDIVLSIQQGAKSGRVYKRGNVTHRASAPGQTPASDTGALIGSIYNEKVTDLTHSVGSRLAYSVSLEYGTRKMAPRPYFRPAVERMRPRFKEQVEALLRGAVR